MNNTARLSGELKTYFSYLILLITLILHSQVSASTILLNDLRYSFYTDSFTTITYTPDVPFMDWDAPYQNSTVSESLMAGSLSSSILLDKGLGDVTHDESHYIIDFEITENTTVLFSGEFSAVSYGVGEYYEGQTSMILRDVAGPIYRIAIVQAGSSTAELDYLHYGVNTLNFSETIDLPPGQYTLTVSSTTELSEQAYASGDFSATFLMDNDGDGYYSIYECNDNDASINPGATEIGGDGIDSNCDGLDYPDVDADGFDNIADCNDNDASIYPGANEVAGDGVDSNCDGFDNPDVDSDGFDSISDCNDNDASIYPGAVEIVGDGVDQSCTGYDLTIVITGAEYSTKKRMLVVTATSGLDKAAQLTLEGYGEMSYSKRKAVWTIKVNRLSAIPASVTVTGVEGSVSTLVTVK